MSDARATRFALLTIVALTAIAWGGSVWGAFQFDDINNVLHDPATTDAGALLDRLSHGLRPLTRLSYFVDARVFGMHAWGFLLTNLGLHVTAALLVFALARRRVEVVGATFAALLFALQPANGEVVAYISGRSTGLMTVLVLAALLLHARGQRAPALVAFVLACLAKEVALIFPALVFVWDSSGGAARRAALRSAAPYAACAAVMIGTLLLLSTYRARLDYSLELRSVTDNLVANGRAIPIMLSLWARPNALSVDHDFTPMGSTALGILGLALISGALVAGIAFRRGVLVFAWPILALLPTSSVIAKIDLVTEKPLYLAWVGPAIALGIALGRGRTRRALAVLVIAALAVGSAWRAHVWSSPVRLWEAATERAPRKSRCWNNLGMAYRAAGRDRDAMRAFQTAAMFDPSNEQAVLNAEITRILGSPRGK